MSPRGAAKRRSAPQAVRPAIVDVQLSSRDTRERLLGAARALFAQHGFSATSVRHITTLAEANLGAVSYYFVSKDLLYSHVLQSILGPLAHTIEGLAKREAPPLTRLEWIVRAFFAHIRANPDMPAFMMRELSHGSTPSGPVLGLISRVLPAISGVIAQGQQIDEIRPGDPVLLTFSVIAQPIHLYLARGAIAAVAQLDVNDPQVLDRIIEHVVVTVRRAMEPK